jgi:hypothetical protein
LIKKTDPNKLTGLGISRQQMNQTPIANLIEGNIRYDSKLDANQNESPAQQQSLNPGAGTAHAGTPANNHLPTFKEGNSLDDQIEISMSELKQIQA